MEYKAGFDNGVRGFYFCSRTSFSSISFQYITWINAGKASWTIKSSALAKDTVVQIGDRPIPQEPMYIIMNLCVDISYFWARNTNSNGRGISEGFGAISPLLQLRKLPFHYLRILGLILFSATAMRVDWIRVYQPEGQMNVGCR